MQKVITETNLDYVKWDLNRSITEAFSPYLEKIGHPQGEFFHRYVQGVYTLYQKLLTAFPHLLIEGVPAVVAVLIWAFCSTARKFGLVMIPMRSNASPFNQARLWPIH